MTTNILYIKSIGGYGHNFSGISLETNIALGKRGWMNAKADRLCNVTYAFDGITTSPAGLVCPFYRRVARSWLVVDLKRTMHIRRVVVYISKSRGRVGMQRHLKYDYDIRKCKPPEELCIVQKSRILVVPEADVFAYAKVISSYNIPWDVIIYPYLGNLRLATKSSNLVGNILWI